MGKRIMTIDNGDGEGTASYLNGISGVPIKLKLQETEKRLVSRIIYSGEDVYVGSRVAVLGDTVIENFKRSPAGWDAIEPGAGKTYREIMKDYIGKVFEQALELGILNGDILGTSEYPEELYVGCPAGKEWTENKADFRQLISEATGFPVERVHVETESRAAVFSAVRGNHISPAGGILVFDIGSYSCDWTYIDLGRIMLEGSWTLGAKAIDNNMMLYAMEELKKMQISEKQLAPNYRDMRLRNNSLEVRRHNLLLFCRKQKELWYGETDNEAYCSHDAEVDIIIPWFSPRPVDKLPEGKSEKAFFGAQTYTVYIEKGFMDHVLYEMPVYNVTNGQSPAPSNGQSWCANLEAFFKEVRSQLEEKQCSFRNIVLTGGSCRIPDIEKICREVFGENSKITKAEAPAFTVSNGLCYVADIQQKLAEIVQTERQDAEARAKKALSGFKDALCAEMQKYILGIVKDTAEYYKTQDYNPMVCTFNGKVCETIKAAFRKEEPGQNPLMLMWNRHKDLINIYESVKNRAESNAGNELYKDPEMRNAFKSAEWDELVRLKSTDFSFGNISQNTFIPLERLISQAAGILFGILAGFVGLVIGGYAAFCEDVANKLHNLFSKNKWGKEIYSVDVMADWFKKTEAFFNNDMRDVPVKKLLKQIERGTYEKKLSESMGDTVGIIVNEICRNQFGGPDELYYDSVQEVAEKTVRITAMDYFENQPEKGA